MITSPPPTPPPPTPPPATPDRRPIASREKRLARTISSALVRAGVSPDAISLAGMLCGVAAGGALAATAQWPDWARLGWLLGAVFVQLRLLCNMFDGMVAIESGRASATGELWNEVPDRIADAATLIGAGYALGGSVAAGYVAACMAVFVAYVRAVGKAATGHNDFCGPMAKPHRMFVITIAASFNALAPHSWQPTLQSLNAKGLGPLDVALGIIIVGGAWTALRRLKRIADDLNASSPTSSSRPAS